MFFSFSVVWIQLYARELRFKHFITTACKYSTFYEDLIIFATHLLAATVPADAVHDAFIFFMAHFAF
jgi:hypothetical protein